MICDLTYSYVIPFTKWDEETNRTKYWLYEVGVRPRFNGSFYISTMSFYKLFCCLFFPNKIVGNECMLHHCLIQFCCEVDAPIGVYKMIFRGKKKTKNWGQESQSSFYKLLSVVFVKSMHQVESIKWFFVVKKTKNWGQESQNSFYKLLSVVFVKSMHQLESIQWFFVVKKKKLGARIPKLIL